MAFEDQTEDDGSDDALAPEAIPDKDELRRKLYGNLSARLNGGVSDDLAYSQKDIADSNRQNALLAALSKSANQIGNVRGQVADSSPVSDMAKSIEGEGAQELQTETQDQGRKDTLDRYLLGQIQRSDSVDARVKAQAKAREDALKQAKEMATSKAAADKERYDSDRSLKQTIAEGNNQTKQAILAAGQGAREQAQGARADAKHDKDFLTLQNALDSTKASSRSAYGKNQAVVDSADKVLQLGEQAKHQEGGLDKRQIHELAMSVGNLVSGGTGTAQATVEALVPHSFGSSAAGVEEWLLSDPQGTNQQAFVDRMLETADRERHLAGEKIKQTQSKILHGPAFQHLKDDPRYDMAQQQNFDPENDQFDKNGVYQIKPYAMKGAPPAAPKPDVSGMAIGAPKTVNIQSPKGTVMSVPADRADYYVKKGGKVVP
jgi:hypothetical protein